VANQLQADGWTNVDVANQSILAKTRIGYKPEALLAARELHDAHPELGPIQEEADTPLGKMLVVRLGKDYPG
jgi:hypothetical protein